jgi:hypothetical protein
MRTGKSERYEPQLMFIVDLWGPKITVRNVGLSTWRIRGAGLPISERLKPNSSDS